MPNSSNQRRVSGGDPRVRIDRVRTASSTAAPSPPSAPKGWAQKASSVKSASSRVAGAPSSPDTRSTSSCRSSRTHPPPGPSAHTDVWDHIGGSLRLSPGRGAGGCLASTASGSAPRRSRVVLSKALLAAARRPGLRRVVTGTPVTRRVVDRFVAGETLDDALTVVRTLTGDGLAVTLDHLGEDVTTRAE